MDDRWASLRASPRRLADLDTQQRRDNERVEMNEREQQTLAGCLAQLSERVERLAQLAEEVASALGAMTGPASALPQEPAEKAARVGRPAA